MLPKSSTDFEKVLSKKYLRIVIVLALLLLVALFYTITKSNDPKNTKNEPQQKIDEPVKKEEAAMNPVEEKKSPSGRNDSSSQTNQ